MNDIYENKEDCPKPILVEDLGTMLPNENSNYKARFGIYKCGFCGTEFKAMSYHINSKNIKSCGCYRKRIISETHKTHGLIGTKLYYIWGEIKRRTLNPKHKQYNGYGGRGITICGSGKMILCPSMIGLY